MNQKEYELIAGVLQTTKDWGKDFRIYKNGAWVANDVYTVLCGNFANRLQREYPKTFDRDKFMEACGL